MQKKISIKELISLLKKYYFIFPIIIGSFIFLNESLYKKMHNFFHPEKRKILSTICADLLMSGKKHKIIKIQTHNNIYIEIYDNCQINSSNLITSINLQDQLDGYISFNNRITNLALDDINNDKKPEIISPSFSNNFTGHLNVFTYNEVSQEYERIINL